MTKRKDAPLIEAATVNRVVSKTGDFLGYLVKSNSNENYYQVTWNYEQKCYKCNCSARVARCCHIQAVSEVCQARNAIAKVRKNVPDFFQALALYAETQLEAEKQAALVNVATTPVTPSLVNPGASEGHSEMVVIAANKDAVLPLVKVTPKVPDRYSSPLNGSGPVGFGVQTRMPSLRKPVPMR